MRGTRLPAMGPYRRAADPRTSHERQAKKLATNTGCCEVGCLYRAHGRAEHRQTSDDRQRIRSCPSIVEELRDTIIMRTFAFAELEQTPKRQTVRCAPIDHAKRDDRGEQSGVTR